MRNDEEYILTFDIVFVRCLITLCPVTLNILKVCEVNFMYGTLFLIRKLRFPRYFTNFNLKKSFKMFVLGTSELQDQNS